MAQDLSCFPDLPEGPAPGNGANAQGDFISALFDAWQSNVNLAVELVNITGQTGLSAAEIAAVASQRGAYDFAAAVAGAVIAVEDATLPEPLRRADAPPAPRLGGGTKGS